MENANLIYESQSTTITRVCEAATNSDRSDLKYVAVKTLKKTNPNAEDLSSLNNEYNILKKYLANCTHAREAISLSAKHEGLHAMQLEWVDGVTLEEWIKNEKNNMLSSEKDLISIVSLMHGIAKAVAEIHEANVLHNDLCADNIIVCADEDEESQPGPGEEIEFVVKIIDFGFACPAHLMEQDDDGDTVNDDIYSLGKIFRNFFSCDDVDDMDQSRSAFGYSDTGMSEGTLPSWLPQSLLGLIANLEMGLQCDKPYQNVREVEEDLEQMLIEPKRFLFDLDPNTISKHLEFSHSRIYGRSREISTLEHAFARVAVSGGGPSEAVFISGPSGVGKSILIEQLRNTVDKRGGFLIKGKFNQLSNTPYEAISSALSDLCDLVITKGDEAMKLWGDEIKQAFETHASLLTSVIPDLQNIIGQPEEDTNVHDVLDAQDRFKFVFKTFFRVISTPDHPVVLFLDDLQWADNASLNLLKTIIPDSENNCLLVIGSFRDNEVSYDHPLTACMEEIKTSSENTITHMHIDDLEINSINTIIAYATSLSRRLTRSLAGIVYQKTQGNAFFTIQFLKSLVDEGLLQPSYDGPNPMRWVWDEEAIMAKDISDNVADLLTAKILKLSRNIQQLLQMASCLGSHVEVPLLELMISTQVGNGLGMNMSIYVPKEACRDLVHSLDFCVSEGFLDKTRDSKYKFVHDRIFQAAYSLVSDTNKDLFHLRIGQAILMSSESDIPESKLFIIVGQMNRGMNLITNRDEQVELASLNLKAAELSMKKAAFSESKAFLLTGIKLVKEYAWRDIYSLNLHLYNSTIETELCLGNIDEVKKYAEHLFENADSFDDKIPAYVSLIRSNFSRGTYEEAISIGLHVLNRLGVHIQNPVSGSAVITDLMRTKAVLCRKSAEDLVRLPVLNDEKIIQIMNVLFCVSGTTYVSGNHHLFQLLTSRMVRLTIRHGVCRYSSIAFNMFGFSLYMILGDLNGAQRLGKVSLALVERLKAKEMVSRCCIYYFSIGHWIDSLRVSIEPLMVCYKSGMETGDVNTAMWSASTYCEFCLYSGRDLATTENETRRFCSEMKEYCQESPSQFTVPVWQLMLNLMGRSKDPIKLDGEAMNSYQNSNNLAEHCVIHFNKMVLAYFFGEHEMAATYMKQCKNIAKISSPSLYVWCYAFYKGLVACSLAQKTRQNKWIKKARGSLKKFSKWSKYSTSNFEHKRLLIKAELVSLKRKNSKQSEEAYDNAIAAAAKSGFLHEEAIACERAGIHFLRNEEQNKASHFLSKSYWQYRKWGAHAKADSLQKEYHALCDNTEVRQKYELEMLSVARK